MALHTSVSQPFWFEAPDKKKIKFAASGGKPIAICFML